jgi:site-specific DNA recombinase
MTDLRKSFFSYIRVSTARQGQTGTSLAEQREAIHRYAERHGFSIVKEYEERETAAKRGRMVFDEMLRALRAGKASGVIVHKVDRSARNLKDWADLAELIDEGTEVHFAGEGIDLNSRGGRLSADIQAVIAADFIRNLREETKKGFYGRIKQGLYPMPARIGYLDQGKGAAKVPDPAQAPLVKEAFELYASGLWGLNDLVEEMYTRGLRNKSGGKVTRNGLSTLLHNPFYAGLVRIKRTGETYPGAHEPLIAQTLFQRTQEVLDGKNVEKRHSHSFLFRKHITCSLCEKTLIPELQKGYTYYRCQVKPCPQKTIREELIEEAFTGKLKLLQFDDYELEYLSEGLQDDRGAELARLEEHGKGLKLQLEQIKERLSKLTDAYLDGALDREMFISKKNSLLVEEQLLKERLMDVESDGKRVVDKVSKILEQASSSYLSYKEGDFIGKRGLVKSTTSNFLVEQKNVSVKLYLPFRLVAERQRETCGSPHRDVARTLSALLSQLYDYVRKGGEGESLRG